MTNYWVLLSGYIITFLIGLPANILAVYAFVLKLSNNPTSSGVLLLNLTVSDLLFLLFLPLKMHEAALGLQWNLSQVLCSIMSFVFFTTIYTSSLVLMAVSVDRYLAVGFPIAYMKFRKVVYGVIGAVFIWTFSAAHCTIVFIVVHMSGQNHTQANGTCYDDFSDDQKRVLLPVRLEFFVVIFFIPLCVCLFCYLNCIWILYHRPLISKEKKQRAIGMALGTLSVFLVCFLPYNLSHLIGYSTNVSPSWRPYALLLSTFNTCLDPIIFYFSSSMYRKTTKFSLKSVFSFWCQKPRT
ncbi:free fatty acid receptor 3-like [Trichomycterus rosablanca]|uniref:free fatty acid receptor 3-like n=1 Tax=Trichomycterus rosablanca TaxID=2290929 RepID=UPI002F356C29